MIISSYPPLPPDPFEFLQIGRDRSRTIRVPVTHSEEALQTLTGIAGGALWGTGITFRTNIEAMRNEYTQQINALKSEIATKRAQGVPDAEI